MLAVRLLDVVCEASISSPSSQLVKAAALHLMANPLLRTSAILSPGQNYKRNAIDLLYQSNSDTLHLSV